VFICDGWSRKIFQRVVHPTHVPTAETSLAQIFSGARDTNQEVNSSAMVRMPKFAVGDFVHALDEINGVEVSRPPN
jgi:hypothetical protein